MPAKNVINREVHISGIDILSNKLRMIFVAYLTLPKGVVTISSQCYPITKI